MPYIPKEDRPQYQDVLNELKSLIPQDRMKRPGHINYIVSLLIEKVYGTNMRYADYNEICGVLDCISKELYRVKAGPYEDDAMKKNGNLSDLPE